MPIDLILFALLAVSLLTNLTVEAIKTLIDKKLDNCHLNLMTAAVSVVLSVVITVGYLIMTETAINSKIAVELIILMYLSFLAATNGYDKVIQTVKEILKKGEQ